jgi:peptide methionine sulfoxide reductase MsrA
MYANAKEVKAVSKDGYYLYCVELAFARVPGVIATSVGYTEGKLEHPR